MRSNPAIVLTILFSSLLILSHCQSATALPVTPYKANSSQTQDLAPDEPETQENNGPLGFYLTKAYIASDALVESGLDCGRLSDQPLLAASEIQSYNWRVHKMRITPEAFQRLSNLEVPTSGLPFVVCLGRHPVYSGAFWTILSSNSFAGVVITLPLFDEQMVSLDLGYPSKDFFEGFDPRPNPFIREYLYQAEKLR